MKYTPEQYRRAKDVVETLAPEQADIVWKRIQEYEATDDGASATNEVTQLPAGSEADFDRWLKLNKVTDLDHPDSHYDYRGAYVAGLGRGGEGHFPDTYKQHGHPTFSVESKYSKGVGDGGRWEGETYVPPDHGFEQPASIADFQSVKPDSDIDGNLASASFRKSLFAPPEYVSKSRSPLGVIAEQYVKKGGAAGLAAATYFEPSEKQFQADMDPYLQAKGVAVGSEPYRLAYAEYKDRKWQQAYQAAEAEDRPLLRAEYVPKSDGWNALAGHLGQAADVADSFAKGIVRGRLPGLLPVASAVSDRITGDDMVSSDRELQHRNPVATGLGEFLGSMGAGSFTSKVSGAVGRLARPATTLGRYATGALAGAAGADAQLLAHAAGEGLADQLHGRPVDPDTKSHFTAKLLGGTLLGGGAGVFGEGVANLAQKYRGSIRQATSDIGPELTNAESSGSATDALRGIKPSSDVEAMLEKARGPVPGEAKLAPTGSAVEYAAGAVREPIVAQQVSEHAAALKRMEDETMRLYGSDPSLKAPKKMTELVKALRYNLLERSQPEASGQFLPSADDALGGRNNGPLIDFARKAIKPRLALGVDAAKEAARTGGEVVSLEDAARMGFKVKGLEKELNPEGVPHDAPSLGDSMPWFPQANPVEVLPKYTKEQLAAHADELVGHPAATPEQAEALRKWSFGHTDAIQQSQRGLDDAAMVANRRGAYGGADVDANGVAHDAHIAEAKEAARHIGEYLAATPPTSKLPFVYRGIVLSRDEAKKFLQQSSFDLGGSVSSVSADPTVARSFVARNTKPGQVGITMKLEHDAARDISPYAADRVKVEKELLMPAGSRFASVARYEDASNPGHYIVVGKQAPRTDGATRPEIDTTAAQTPPDVEVPSGYQPKSFQVILEPRAYDALKMEQQIKAIDQAGKAGTEAKVDPVWPELMRAARVDREQFGKAWSGLKNVHHEELTALEQRAAHAGITERNPYPEMSGNAQKTANSAITNYGVAPQATNEALSELADNAGVRGDLETLKGTRAYAALKEKAAPKANEGLTQGGGFLRVGGLLPGAKLRADALARGITRGPEGNPLFVQQFNPALINEPIGRELLPSSGLLAMGRGALGVKTGSVYDSATGRAKPAGTLSPQEREQLERLLTP